MALKDSTHINEVATVDEASARLEQLFPPMPESSVLTVSCLPADYSASRIACAVEDCDASLVNLNVLSGGGVAQTEDQEFAPAARVTVELRVNHRNPMSVARSLERYGYEIVDVDSPWMHTDPGVADRVAELLHYLELD